MGLLSPALDLRVVINIVHEIILVAEVVGIDVDVAESLGELLLWGSLEFCEEILKRGFDASLVYARRIVKFVEFDARHTLLDRVIDRCLVS